MTNYIPKKIINLLSLNFTFSQNLQYLAVFLVYLIIARFVAGSILFSDGTVGLFHDWYIGPFPEMMNQYTTDGFFVWNSQTGNIPYAVDWIIRIISIPFSFLGGEIYSKALIIITISLSGFTTFYLGRTVGLNPFISFIAGVLYIFSPIVFTRIIAGYMYYLIGYALAPAILAMFLKGYDDQGKKTMFIVAGLLTAVAIIQLQFLIMILVVLFVFVLVKYERIRTGLAGISIVFAVSFFVTLFPVILSQVMISSSVDIGKFNPGEIYGELEELPVASNLKDSFRMLGYGLHPYSYLNLGTPFDYVNFYNEIIPHWVFYANFIIPIASFSTLLFRRDKFAISFAILALIGLFILKGPNPPFSEFFEKFFPLGLFIFREVWHSVFLYGLAVTFLVAFLLNRVSTVGLKKIQNQSMKSILKYSAITFIVILMLVSNGYPMFTGDFAGYVQTFTLSSEDESIYTRYSFNDSFNTLILPMFTPLRYDGNRLSGIDPIVTYSPNMIFPPDSAIGDIRHPTSGVSLWISSLMTNNKTDHFGNLLSGFGIRYVILRGNVESQFLDFIPQGQNTQVREKWNSFDVESFLDQQTDLMKVENLPDYKVYKNINNSTKMFSPRLLIGGLTNFDYLMHISQILPLSEAGVYGPTANIQNLSSLLLASEDELKFPQDTFIPLGQFVRTEDPERGWVSNLDSFTHHHFLPSRINSGIFAVKPDSKISLELPLPIEENQSLTVWAKLLEWNKGGNIDIDINGKTNSISLFSESERISVVPIQNLSGPDIINISITNVNGANYVEGIYYARQGETEQGPSHSVDSGKKFIGGYQMRNDPNGILSNPSFLGSLSSELKLEGYTDPLGSCGSNFECLINKTSGWEDDSSSLQISTPVASKNTWSWIYSNPVIVRPGERYDFVSHMNTNTFTRDSHIVLEGLNSENGTWLQIEQCPSAADDVALVDWNQFECFIQIPENVVSLRIVLNAGYSTSEGETAQTQFDGLYLNRIDNQAPTNPSTLQEFVDNSTSPETASADVNGIEKINPTLWNARISAKIPFTLAFAEPYDSAWKATVYRDGKELQEAYSEPLYDSINSFSIDHAGELDLVIENARQDWFNIGLTISGISLIVCLYVILLQRKARNTAQL